MRDGLRDLFPATSIDLRDPGVHITISGPNQQPIASALLAALRVTPIDRLGCAARVATIIPTAAGSAPAGMPHLPFLGEPVSGVACQYLPASGNEPRWLDGSVGLSAEQLRTLAATLASATMRGGFTDIEPTVRYQLRYADETRLDIAVSRSPLVASDGYQALTSGHSTDECYGTCPPSSIPGPFNP